MIRFDSIKILTSHRETLPAVTCANASFVALGAVSDFSVKVRVVLGTVYGPTERFFEILIRSLGKSMIEIMKYCQFHGARITARMTARLFDDYVA
mgnify:CR=1 FL=1